MTKSVIKLNSMNGILIFVENLYLFLGIEKEL